MRLADIRRVYPVAGSVLRRILDEDRLDPTAAETLSTHALERIDSGATTERDARLLLWARDAMRARSRR